MTVSGSTLDNFSAEAVGRKMDVFAVCCWKVLFSVAGSVGRDWLSGGVWSVCGAEVGAGWGLIPAHRTGKAAGTCTL